ncbi:NAD(P)/FAD-dependent oxidoreductase [Neolewinella sp.]|uniref:NAD(P)/FAD-dependent oxidoreductase n=1 Tax=Neolewinella sp. TaxID=2993543 RepID=UPI003B51787E
MRTNFDVIVIGGSYAGLSAAMVLGRSLRHTLIIDGGDPCNKRTPYAHNFITHDGESPLEIAARAREQVLAYEYVSRIEDQATELDGEDGAFILGTTTGTTYTAKKVVFATGLHDGLPDIPGVLECWGKTAIHCPYCHGYEIRGQPTGLLLNNDHVPFMTRLIGNLTDELTLFTNGPANFDVQEIEGSGVRVMQQSIDELQHEDGNLRAVCLADGTAVPLTAFYLHPHLSQRCALPEAVGCTLDEDGFLQVDDRGLTTIAGIYAAGDCTTMMRSVAYATGSGNKVGAMVNAGLLL